MEPIKEDFSIRSFSEYDADAVKNLIVILQNCEKTFDSHRLDGPKIAERYFTEIRTKSQQRRGQIFVAVANETIIGFTCVWIEKDDETITDIPEWGYLSDLVVAENYRGKGVGRALIKEAENFIKKSGHNYLKMEVVDKNTLAKKMYLSLGFEPHETTFLKKL